MNTISLALILSTIISGYSCNVAYRPNPDPIVKVVVKAGYSLSQTSNSKFFTADVIILNNSDSIVNAYCFECSFYDNLISSSESVRIVGNDCPSNFGRNIRLEPKQEVSVPILMEAKNDFLDKRSLFKIGFIYIKPQYLRDYNIIEFLTLCKQKQQNIIWSDQIFLYMGASSPYEIRWSKPNN